MLAWQNPRQTLLALRLTSFSQRRDLRGSLRVSLIAIKSLISQIHKSLRSLKMCPDVRAQMYVQIVSVTFGHGRVKRDFFNIATIKYLC